jgi:hypothetical protein
VRSRNERPRKALTKKQLETTIQAATVDCYNESEEITGWFTMLEESLAVPFETRVLGVLVTVERITLSNAYQIVAVCSRDRDWQALPILDLPLPRRRPEGSEWIEAYRHWLGGRPGEWR